MNRIAVIQAAVLAVEALEERPSVRNVQAMSARICGYKLQTRDVAAVVRERTAQLDAAPRPYRLLKVIRRASEAAVTVKGHRGVPA